MLITYPYRTYPRTQPVWSIGRSERDRLARSRYRRMAAGPVRNISRMQFKNTSDITLQTDTNRHDNEGELHAKLMSRDRAGFETRCLRGQAAVPVGGGGAWPRCRWAAAGPGQATHRHPDRLEAVARPAGPGRASSRRAERSSRRGRRAGGQASRRPEICRGNKQHEAARPHRGRAAHASGRKAALSDCFSASGCRRSPGAGRPRRRGRPCRPRPTCPTCAGRTASSRRPRRRS